MPTARELLEQADALMRRNRAHEIESDIPELTDEIAVAASGPAMRESPQPSRAPPPRLELADDVPELLDAVEELSIQPLPDDDDEVSRWLEVDLGAASITGPAPDSVAIVPSTALRSPPPAAPAMEAPAIPPTPPTASAALLVKVSGTLSGPPAEPPPKSDPGFDAMLGESPVEAAFEHELAPPAVVPAESLVPPVPAMPAVVAAAPALAAPPAAPEVSAAPAIPDVPAQIELPAPLPVAEPPPSRVPDEQQWEGLAEEIRMQVLQRIDIFTDTGLHGELAARLQPIVDRASADLVTTINREVGQILRAYVAEAIEREIETWREGNP